MTYQNKNLPQLVVTMDTNRVFDQEKMKKFDYKLKKQRKRNLWTEKDKSDLFLKMMQNLIIGHFHFVDTKGWSDDLHTEDDKIELSKEIRNDVFRVLQILDGNQKTGIIFDIMQDKVLCSPGKVWVYCDTLKDKKQIEVKASVFSDLPENLQKSFLNHQWQCHIYHKDMTLAEKGEVMRTIDTGAKMIEAELVNTSNSIGIDLIREKLFENDEENIINKNCKLFWKMKDKEHLTENFLDRYRLNHWIMFDVLEEINYRDYGFHNSQTLTEKTGTCNVRNMVENNQLFKSENAMNSILNSVFDDYNLLHDLFESSDMYNKDKNVNKLQLDLPLVRIYLNIIQGMRNKYGVMKKDWRIDKAPFSLWLKDLIIKLKTRENDLIKTDFEQVMTKKYVNQIILRNSYILNELEDEKNGFFILDKSRVCPQDTLKKVWESQGKRCAVFNNPIEFEDCVPAHKNKPFCEGGDTSIENTVAITRTLNNQQGREPFASFSARMRKDYPNLRAEN
tara:strand:+ start:180 stop:1694 length:1515 start_codon:yes stop_codon:yes gene_type:complete